MSAEIHSSEASEGPHMSLNRIDSSLLHSLISHLDGVDISMLWFTGDRKLRYLMSQGRGVTRFTTEFQSPTLSIQVRFPRLVTSFPGLKTLELSSFRVPFPDITEFECMEQLESLILKRVEYSGLLGALLQLPNPFPNLTSLDVIDGMTWSEWPEATLKCLPRTLQTLKIEILENSSQIALLPSSLTSLVFHASDITYGAVACPPNLTKLSMTRKSIFDDDQEIPNLAPFIASLPRTLQWLKLCDVQFVEDCVNVLPPSLTRLVVNQVNAKHSALASLKTVTPHLTHLNVLLQGRAPASVVHHLSPSLKYVSVHQLSSPSAPITFPQSATYLTLPSFFHSTQDIFQQCINLLPPGLTRISLKFVNASFLNELVIKALPKTITHLDLPLLNDYVAMNLPLRLRTLNSSATTGTPDTLSQMASLHLPASLTKFSFDKVAIPSLNEWIFRFHSLQALTLTFCGIPRLTASDLASLPPSITELRLSVVRAQLKRDFPGKDAWVEAMKDLNRLDKFSLIGNNTDPDILYGFQKPLLILILDGIPSEHPLKDEHLSALNLKMLGRGRIGGASICTDKSISSLPCHASSFEIAHSPHLTAEGQELIQQLSNVRIS
jgi:hypothetical protein